MRFFYLILLLFSQINLIAGTTVPCTDYPFVQTDKTTGVRIEGYPNYSTISRKNTVKVFSKDEYLYSIEDDDIYSSSIFTDKSGMILISAGYNRMTVYEHGVLKSSIIYWDLTKEKSIYDSLIDDIYINFIFSSCKVREYFWSPRNDRKYKVKLFLKDIIKSNDSLSIRITKDKYIRISLRTGDHHITSEGISYNSIAPTVLKRVYMDAPQTFGNWIIVNKKFVSLEQFFSERLKLKLTMEGSDSSKQKIFISILTNNKGYIVFPGSKVETIINLRGRSTGLSTKWTPLEQQITRLSEVLFQNGFRLLPINPRYKLEYHWQDVEFYLDEKNYQQ